MQRPHDVGRGWHKTMIKFHHPDKLLQAAHNVWTGKPKDGVDPVRQGNRALRSHAVAEEVDVGYPKTVLAEVDSQAMLTEPLTELPEVGTMLLPRAAGHQDVVEVHRNKLEAVSHPVHQPLECLRSVLKAEWHPHELVQPERRDDCRLGYILQVDRDLVITSYQIRFGAYSSPGQMGVEVLDVGYGVSVCGCCSIQLPIIPARSPAPASLWDHVERRRPWAV
ncbi:uncharacterized protein LOC116980683 [Amblyraja radiata]|uniref:uncharacterized protein LOC116980683 n=1 Tax=Amblyraja radiata TaxID=386614 RepID=UPI00140355D1|nr:uncharacterized protein LOC116980683 [Amblyraja radiata]